MTPSSQELESPDIPRRFTACARSLGARTGARSWFRRCSSRIVHGCSNARLLCASRPASSGRNCVAIVASKAATRSGSSPIARCARLPMPPASHISASRPPRESSPRWTGAWRVCVRHSARLRDDPRVKNQLSVGVNIPCRLGRFSRRAALRPGPVN